MIKLLKSMILAPIFAGALINEIGISNTNNASY